MEAKTISVFFYGLFMDEALLATKDVQPATSEPAVLDGWALRIGERATLVPAENQRAWGLLMTLVESDAAKLYDESSVADYRPVPVHVTLGDGSTRPAVCYNLPLDRLSGTNPEYAAELHGLARRFGFPPEYLDHIETLAG